MGLAEQAAFLNSILESSTEYSIVAKDLDGTILAWNEGARRIYGYEAGDIVGKASAFLLHHPEDVKSGRARAILEEVRNTGKWEGVLRRVPRPPAPAPRPAAPADPGGGGRGALPGDAGERTGMRRHSSPRRG